jgi:dihydrofolate synthase/folylpolyglutamate synthase
MGEHQALNAAAAIAAAERTGLVGARLTPEVVRAALRRVQWPGRMEFVPGRPPLVLDGAHNRASVERLAEALARHFPGRLLAVVFAAAADKDLRGMMAALAGKMPDVPVVFTRTESPRAADPNDLAAEFAQAGGRGAATAADARSAIEAAAQSAGPDGLVVACGSLYLVGEVKQRILNVEY